MTKKTILLAAGGTGGHLYPAEALAQELLNRGHHVVIVTDKRGNAFQKLGDKVKIHCVKAATFKPGILPKIKAVFDIGIGILQASKLIFKYKPDLMVGFGGYPSFPSVFAAQRLGTPTILHEQNAVLGKANIWLANGAQKIAASLPNTLGILEKNMAKTTVTGNPVRASFCDLRDKPYPKLTDHFNIFITGGSQGAAVFSDVIPKALDLLPEDVKSKISVIHQCPKKNLASTEETYKKAGIKAEVSAFFNDIAEKIGNCHLLIARSGASTVAEVAVIGRPAIFIPYPGHADMQQKHNAELISSKNGGWVILQNDLEAKSLSSQIENLAKNPAILENAASAAKSCGQPDAVKKLADLIENK